MIGIWWMGLALASTPDAAAEGGYEQALTEWLVSLDTPADEAAETAQQMVGFEASLPWQSGSVSVADGAVTLTLAPGERYADPEAASAILEAWGNPPDATTEGLLLPTGIHLFGPDSWAVLVSFMDDGWVDDSDASSIDYDELMSSMQEGQEAANEQRAELGLQRLHLTGWTEPPHYDATSRVLYWASTVRSEQGGETLNYDVRVLGRRGVLSLNALADVSNLDAVRLGMERVRNQAAFEEGHRYEDYVPGTDTKAAYGLAALVAGGAIAAKSGLLKGLLAMLLAGKKFIIIGFVALLGGIKTLFGRGSSDSD